VLERYSKKGVSFIFIHVCPNAKAVERLRIMEGDEMVTRHVNYQKLYLDQIIGKEDKWDTLKTLIVEAISPSNDDPIDEETDQETDEDEGTS
jgi:hypothetical protein